MESGLSLDRLLSTLTSIAPLPQQEIVTWSLMPEGKAFKVADGGVHYLFMHPRAMRAIEADAATSARLPLFPRVFGVPIWSMGGPSTAKTEQLRAVWIRACERMAEAAHV